jgi:putative transcriptional regulator
MSATLKNNLAECLTERKIRQSQLARRLRMSPAYVSRLCSGKIQPSIESALRIARYFEKPVEQIFQLVEGDDKKSNLPSRFTPAPAKPVCSSPATLSVRPAVQVVIPDRSLVGPAAKVVASPVAQSNQRKRT